MNDSAMAMQKAQQEQRKVPVPTEERLALRDVIHQTGELLADCHAILDRLIGPRPPSDSNAPSPAHIISELEMSSDYARWSAQELRNRIEELSARL